MRLLLALACLIAPTICAKPGNDAIRLSNVQTLTLHANRLTSARRVSPIPQLNCIGPNKKVCNLYQPDVMRCTNQGHDYDLEDVQWTCTADLPPEFKLGATDVICEGYRHADDKWVLKGSCGVEYRMLLTELGEERFGYTSWETTDWDKMSKSQKFWTGLGNLIFFGFLLAVFLMIAVPFVLLLAECLGLRRSRGDGEGRRWGGGGGPGGGGPPPPPYSAFDSHKSTDDQRWRPGFWSGAAGGAAAGYGLGRYYNGERRTAPRRSGGYDAGEGSSRTPSFSSTTASTGFGSTRRR